MSKRLAEIQARQTEVKAALEEIYTRSEPLEDDSTRADELVAEWDALEVEAAPLIERAVKLESIRSASLDDKNVERAFHAPNVVVKRDPFENLDSVRTGMVPEADMRARALEAVESVRFEGVTDEARENATRLIEGLNVAKVSDRSKIARYALLTGSPAYRNAFEKILRAPQRFGSMLTPEESDALDQAEAVRAALSDTGANGGYAIPFLLDPTVILTNAGAANPFRQISRTVRGTSNIWHGLSSAGVTAEWKSEGAAAADASPTFVQPAITAYLADAYVFGSYEVFEDTNLATDLPMLIADAKDRLESAAFATGSGSGQPYGVVTQVTAVTTSRVSPQTAGSFTSASVQDVHSVITGVPPRWRSKSSWIANYSVLDTIRSMSATGHGSSFWATLDADVPERLLGRPVYEASSMTSTITTGSNILLAGDFQNYVIFDRIGMQLEYIPNVVDASTARPTGQRGWFATWRVGADLTAADAFRVLKL